MIPKALVKEPVNTNNEVQEWSSQEWESYLEPVVITDKKDLSFEEFLLQEEGEQ